jgi:hypothetical protein
VLRRPSDRPRAGRRKVACAAVVPAALTGLCLSKVAILHTVASALLSATYKTAARSPGPSLMSGEERSPNVGGADPRVLQIDRTSTLPRGGRASAFARGTCERLSKCFAGPGVSRLLARAIGRR